MNKIIINNVKNEKNNYVMEGIYNDNGIYPFVFMGNENQSIVNYKEMIIEYSLFEPISSNLKDCVVNEDVVQEIKKECLNYIDNIVCEKPITLFKKSKNQQKNSIYVCPIDDSSVIELILYVESKKTLGIVFKGNESLYLYIDVEYEDFENFINADSKGKFLPYIKKNFECYKLSSLKDIDALFENYDGNFYTLGYNRNGQLGNRNKIK